ncbi:hypothetical protein H0H87_012897 [Tephrocybe sp. NHM501043]|nr:hypothetical protein H0H87_012897 [Tephrocybe sp. NHM501043]
MPPNQSKRILVIDGGGFRAYGSLLVLQDVMKAVESRARQALRPCDVFDLICGTSTGGLVAILLGRFGLDCAKAIEAYKALTLSVCGSSESTFWENILKTADTGLDSSAFETSLAQAIEGFTGLKDALMSGEERDELDHLSTNTFVTLTSEAPNYDNRTHCIRSYTTRLRQPPPFEHKWLIHDVVRGILGSNIFLPSFFLTGKYSFGDASFAGFSSPIGLIAKEGKALWPNDSNYTIINLGPSLQSLGPTNPRREWAVTDSYSRKFADQIIAKVHGREDMRPRALNLVKHFVQLSIDTELSHSEFAATGASCIRLCPPLGIEAIDLADCFHLDVVEKAVRTWLHGDGKRGVSDITSNLVELKKGAPSVEEARFVVPPSPPPNTNPGYNPRLDERRPETMIDYLRNYRVFFLIDDSGSMKGERWAETRDALMEIAEHALEQNVDEIDLRFFNNQGIYRGIKGKSIIGSIFSTVEPSGYTPTGATLFTVLDEHLTRLDQAVNTLEYSIIKPLDVIMLTDGVPTDKPKDVLVEAASRMKLNKHHPNAMGVQIVQIGNDPDAVPVLKQLMFGDIGVGV